MDLIYLFLKVIAGIIGIFFLCFFISFVVWLLYFLIKEKRRFPENEYREIKKKSVWYRLFYELPRQFWLDRFNACPGEFQEYGMHLICGEQGAGKSTTVVDLLLNRWGVKYPRLKIYTNMEYKKENGKIEHWKDLLSEDRENGIYGVVNVIDEISGWFSSLQSKDFPPEMLREISQQRKQRRVILRYGSSFWTCR